MIKTLLLLILFNFVASDAAIHAGLPLPGPLVGLVCMAVYVWLNKPVLEEMQPHISKLLRHLSLFFVPAGVGVMVHTSLLFAQWPIILIAIIISTVLTLAVTAITFQFSMRFLAGMQPAEI